MDKTPAYARALVAEMASAQMPAEEAVSAAISALTAATAATPGRRYYVPLTAGGVLHPRTPAAQ